MRALLQKMRKYIWEMLPILLIAMALAAYVLSATLEYGRLVERLGSMDGGWTLSGRYVDALPLRDYKSAKESSVLSVSLGEEFAAPRAICFYTVYADVDVRLDGQNVYRFRAPDGSRSIQASPKTWNIVTLAGGSDGKLLEVELSSPYENYANLLPEFRFGSVSDVSDYVTMNTMPHFIAALAILFVGLVFALIAMTMRFFLSGNTGIYSLSLFIVMLAIFLIAQQTSILMRIYDGVSYVLIENMAFLLCPVLYSRYLMRSKSGVHRKISVCLYIVSIINALIVLLLQILNVFDMPQMVAPTRYLCVAIAGYVLVLELQGRGRVWYCLAALAAIGVVLYYYLTENISWLVYAGLFAYLYLMFYRLISSVVRTQAEQIRLGAALKVSKSELATVQITSHFFYHTLDSIRALIRLDADKAYKMTGDFAKYYRYRVDGVERMEECVSFGRELRAIRAYTDIKQAQLGERFRMIFDVETEDFVILPLTVQPLVENAVIHAVQKRREGGVVRLICRENEKEYAIQVIDNGPGATIEEAQEAQDTQKRSVAIANVNIRLSYYGIAPLIFEKNEMGGMTVRLNYPKDIDLKGKAKCE